VSEAFYISKLGKVINPSSILYCLSDTRTSNVVCKDNIQTQAGDFTIHFQGRS